MRALGSGVRPDPSVFWFGYSANDWHPGTTPSLPRSRYPVEFPKEAANPRSCNMNYSLNSLKGLRGRRFRGPLCKLVVFVTQHPNSPLIYTLNPNALNLKPFCGLANSSLHTEGQLNFDMLPQINMETHIAPFKKDCSLYRSLFGFP